MRINLCLDCIPRVNGIKGEEFTDIDDELKKKVIDNIKKILLVKELDDN